MTSPSLIDTQTHSLTRGKRISFAAAALALAAIHLGLTNYFMPLRGVFSNTLLTGDDYDLHIGQVFKVVEGLERWGHSWIYDVQLIAGQPEGTITDSGTKAWELWTFALHRAGVAKVIAFNSFALFAMLVAPLVLFVAARVFRLGPWSSLLAAAMGSSLWFFDSNLHWMWFIGMISWALSASLSILTLGLFYRFLEQPSLRWCAPAALCLGVNLLIHPYCFFALAPPMAAMYLRGVHTAPPRLHGGVASMLLGAFAINGYWLLNAARHWHYILNSAFYAQADARFLLCDVSQLLCSGVDTGLVGTRTGFRFLYLGLALAALWLARARRDPRCFVWSVSLATCYVFAYLSDYLPGMQQTQPYRQIIPGMLVSVIPAALFIGNWLEQRGWRGLPRGTQLLIGVGGCVILQLLAAEILYFVPRALPEPRRLLDGSPSHISKYGFLLPTDGPSDLHYGVPHDPSLELGVPEVLAWIDANVPQHARVLVEGNMLGERLAWRGHVEVLGGFFERNVRHVYANFFRDHQWRRASTEELARYVQVFAVDWVVGNRPEFERDGALFERMAKVGGRTIYRTRRHGTRVLQGGGSVQATSNRIDVQGSDPQQAVLLAYHWHEALRCRPNCRIERADVPPDKVGLLRVPSPHPATFSIWNSYEF